MPSGTGVVQNLQRARDLLELGVEAGDAACQKQLASFAFELIAAGGESSGSKD
jgi:hypothetical protein